MTNRSPYHLSLHPEALFFPCQMEVAKPIRLQDGAIKVLWCEAEEHLESDHAIFKATYSNQTVLLRRSPASSFELETQVYQLLKALKLQGAPVIPFLEAPILSDGSCYSVQPYLEHHLYQGADAELAALGQAVEQLSKAYSRLAQSLKSQKHIIDIWVEETSSYDNCRAAHEICCNAFTSMRSQPGGAHNDLHPGNVLFRANGAAVIIDFEESIQYQSHALLDLHAAIERFVLINQPSRDKVQQVVKLFGCLSDHYDLELFRAIGVIKNTCNMGLAQISQIDSESDKFERLRNLWIAL